MSKLWADFIPAIVSELPDCPRFTMASAVQYVAREFYRNTRAWRARDVLLATTVAGQAGYTVTTNPADTILVGLPAVWIADKEVDELPFGGEDDVLPTDRDDRPAVGVTGPTSILLVPPPLSSGLLVKATVAYAPSPAATGISDQLHDEHHEAIERAAVARLKRMTGKPWSDMQGAVMAEQEAHRLALQASSAAGPQRRRAALRVKAW